MGNLTSTITAEALNTLPSKSDLSHIPGEDGLPFFGTTFRVLKDPIAFTRSMHKKYGLIYRTHNFFMKNVSMLGPEANELVLFDKNKIFSSDLGWTPTLELLFPRGLMLLDFEVHRSHRKTMQVAFKTEAMRSYIDSLNEGIQKRLGTWSDVEDIQFYPFIKSLTLELAASPFLGIPWGPQADKINKSFIDMVAATISPIRRPWPFTAMAKGVAGRRYMSEYFGSEIPKRRGANSQNMFTLLCNAFDENGQGFTDQEIIDHMNFLMMAAHDTITSSMTSTIFEMARNPEWQEKLRDEVTGLNGDEDFLSYDQLGDLPLSEMLFKEVLRLHAPVPVIPRTALKDFEFKGYRVPAGTLVGVNPQFTHKMPEHWPDPEKFDPLRFTPEETAKRNRFAWVPFGGGAHMCLGLHFAYMQAKVFLYHFLRHYEVSMEPHYSPKWRPWPIYKPADGLPVHIKKLR